MMCLSSLTEYYDIILDFFHTMSLQTEENKGAVKARKEGPAEGEAGSTSIT